MARNPSTEQTNTRHVGYGFAIVMDAIILYAVHHLVQWDVPYITPAFADVVWAFDISLGTSIAVNALLMIGDLRWWRRLCDVARDATALLPTYVLYQVFPFDLPGAWIANLFGMMLVFVMLVLVISIVVHSMQAVAEGVNELATT